MRHFFLLVAACPLAACIAGTAPEARAGDSCGAEPLQVLVGQPESALAAISLAGPFRIIHPTDRVTRDMRSDRVNFDIDAQGVIARVHCG